MGTGYGSAPLALSLERGQVQRVLVEAGSSVLVVEGAAVLRFPFVWLAEHVVARHLPLEGNAVHRLEAGGWIELAAIGACELLILPPEVNPHRNWLLRIVCQARLAGASPQDAVSGA